MRTFSGPGPVCFYFYKVWLSAILAVLSCSGSAAQARPPKYDLATETKMKGVVEELKLPPKGQEKEVAHLLMKNGDDMIDVYLCPKSFMDDMGVTFSKGDAIAFTGSKVKQDGADLILARQVVKGQDTLVLRDDKGNPVWNWGH
jgi:hypothetical protein